jgi:preprotein translocase subunit YajC
MSLAAFFAQTANATNAATAAAPEGATAPRPGMPMWASTLCYILMAVALYFLFIRPTTLAQKKKAETVKGAKTGDRVITTSGIHGVITNVKETTVIVKVHDNVKLEVEKEHIDKITRPAPGSEPDPVAKA